MKKLFFILLGVLLLGIVANSCRQSVEPGENGFPTMEEIQEYFAHQAPYAPQVRKFMVTIIKNHPEWIETINKIYITQHGKLDLDTPEGYHLFWKLLFKEIPEKEIEQVTTEAENKIHRRIGSGSAAAMMVVYYENFLMKNKNGQ